MIDIIGEIKDIGNYTETGEVITPPKVHSGWHINSSKKIDSLSKYYIEPKTPRRVFYGANTYCYAFPDENTGRGELESIGLLVSSSN